MKSDYTALLLLLGLFLSFSDVNTIFLPHLESQCYTKSYFIYIHILVHGDMRKKRNEHVSFHHVQYKYSMYTHVNFTQKVCNMKRIRGENVKEHAVQMGQSSQVVSWLSGG